MDALPFSQACENNKGPILQVLTRVFADRRRVVEIGSGTGQHAEHFATELPQLQWQPTEIPEYLSMVQPRLDLYQGDNMSPAQCLDVRERPWQVSPGDALFSANTLHIMAFESVQELFAELTDWAPADMVLAVYGPFNYGGQYTSDSNARFDQWLASQAPHSAIRDFEAVDALASAAGFSLQEDNALPANNRLLVWRKTA